MYGSLRKLTSALLPATNSRLAPICQIDLNFSRSQVVDLFESAHHRKLSIPFSVEDIDQAVADGRAMDAWQMMVRLPNRLRNGLPNESDRKASDDTLRCCREISQNEVRTARHDLSEFYWRILESEGFVPIIGMDIMKMVVMEALGYSTTEPSTASTTGADRQQFAGIPIKPIDDQDKDRSSTNRELKVFRRNIQSWAFVSGVSPQLFVAYQAKELLCSRSLLKYFSIGSSFRWRQRCSRLCASAIWARSQEEADESFCYLKELCQRIFSSLGVRPVINYRKPELLPNCSELSVDFSHPITDAILASVHLMGCYPSRRLFICRKPGQQLLYFVYAEMVDLNVLNEVLAS